MFTASLRNKVLGFAAGPTASSIAEGVEGVANALAFHDPGKLNRFITTEPIVKLGFGLFNAVEHAPQAIENYARESTGTELMPAGGRERVNTLSELAAERNRQRINLERERADEIPRR